MANLSPFPVFRAFDANGNPLVGGQLYTYVSGTTTPKVSFKDHTGLVANTNPVILDSRGEARVWLDGVYTLRLVDSLGSTLWTVDEVVGIGTGESSGGAETASEWLVQADAPTYISGTQYSVPGDRTADYHVGRRQRAQVSGGIAYGRITASVFSTGTTTITVSNDSIALDGGLSEVSIGINSADNPSISVDCIEGLGALDTIQTGMIFMWGAATTPGTPGAYLFCDGAEVSRTTYAGLYAVIGDTWGSGDGSTTFNLPDLQGRSPIGPGQGDTAEGGGAGTPRSLSDKLGAETHTLVTAEIPTRNITMRTTDEDTGAVAGSSPPRAANNSNTTVNVGGSDQPHNNMSPSLVIGFIIKT